MTRRFQDIDLSTLLVSAANEANAAILNQLISQGREAPANASTDLVGELQAFIFDRLRAYYVDRGVPVQQFEAVAAVAPASLVDFGRRLTAIAEFAALPEAEALAAANKRIVNILKKAEGAPGEPDLALLQEEAEKALFRQVVEVAPLVRSHVANEDYTAALCALAGLRAAVDQFFEDVMVMAEEPLTRANRLALLAQLAGLMNQVADISRLSA